ncbi:MAG: hypothetical protein ACRD9S_22280, partial [Pyrinomonadaceae bacterium]
QVVKKIVAETTHDNANGDETTTATTYLITSTVLGGRVVSEVSTEPGRRGFVYLGSEVLAWQRVSGTTEIVNWEHRDPGNASFRMTFSSGAILTSEKAELDPLNTNAGTADPTTVPSLKKLLLYPGFGAAAMRGDTQCIWDDLELPCTIYADAINSGSAAEPSRQRGPNVGAPTRFGWFDNAAEYGDSVDAWDSPLWVPAGKADRRGLGQSHFAHAPQKSTEPQDSRTDCQRFADMVAEIAGRNNSAERFMDEMARTFTAANNSSRAEMRANLENALPPDRMQIGDAGFRPELRDGTNLQVRHFVGGLLYGYRYGYEGPMVGGAISEALSPAPTGSMADVRLNDMSMRWGAGMEPRPASVTSYMGAVIRTPAHPGYRGLADLIRRDICE